MEIGKENKERIERLYNLTLRDGRFAQENPTRIKDELGWISQRLDEPDLSDEDRTWGEEMQKNLQDVQLIPRGFLGGTATDMN
jgi:hypothetical protein